MTTKPTAGFILAALFSCAFMAQGADFNGDGTNDPGYFRRQNGFWKIRNLTQFYFGSSIDQPLPADYNGDGTVEAGFFRPATGLWKARGLTSFYFGGSADEPLPGIGAGRSLWNNDGSNIYYNAGKVGIGTDAPTCPLHVKANYHGGWLVGIHNTGYALNDYGLVVRADYGDPFLVQIFNGGTALRVESDGDVGIKVDNPAYALDVKGDIRATGSVRYGGTAGVPDGTQYTKPDYVFEDSYRAMEIDEVEAHLEREKHLPWITAAEDEEEGSIDMTRMAFETLETAENLQLQVIALDKLARKQQLQIEAQNSRLKLLEEKLAKLAGAD